MNSPAANNLRQALPDAEHGSLDNLAAKAAVTWASAPNVAIDGILDELDLLDIAQRALVAGETVEDTLRGSHLEALPTNKAPKRRVAR